MVHLTIKEDEKEKCLHLIPFQACPEKISESTKQKKEKDTGNIKQLEAKKTRQLMFIP